MQAKTTPAPLQLRLFDKKTDVPTPDVLQQLRNLNSAHLHAPCRTIDTLIEVLRGAGAVRVADCIQSEQGRLRKYKNMTEFVMQEARRL